MTQLPSALKAPTLLGSGAATVSTTSRPALQVALGQAGRCPHQPTLLVTIYDDSGSVLGGNDSTGMRYEETQLAVERVARRCRCGNELVAVLHMDCPTRSDLKPTPINRKMLPNLAHALQVPSDTDGASSMTATLARARTLVANHPQHEVTLLVATDFALSDDMPTLYRNLADFPGAVHAVVLRAEPPVELTDVVGATVSTVRYGTPPGAVARAIFRAMTAHRPNSNPTQED